MVKLPEREDCQGDWIEERKKWTEEIGFDLAVAVGVEAEVKKKFAMSARCSTNFPTEEFHFRSWI
jgi:hypothetical protein